MPKPLSKSDSKNLISKNLIALRKQHHLSQRGLASRLQLLGYDMDKNVITRIETNKRYVTDIELQALCQVFHVTYEDLIDGVINEGGTQIIQKEQDSDEVKNLS